jgi:hypothetical protein
MFGLGKKKLNGRHNIRELEKEAADSVSKKYKVSTQQTSKRTGKRPDVFGINPKNNRDRIIVDAKCVSEVRPENIKQLKEYKKIFFAKKAVIHTASDTKISSKIRNQAKDAKISFKKSDKIKRKKYFYE